MFQLMEGNPVKKALLVAALSGFVAFGATDADAKHKHKHHHLGSGLVHAGESAGIIGLPFIIVGHTLNVVTYPLHAVGHRHHHHAKKHKMRRKHAKRRRAKVRGKRRNFNLPKKKKRM